MESNNVNANCSNDMNNEFLAKLADLCDTYKVSFEYTKDNDGIHISFEGNEVFAGFLGDDASAELRARIIPSEKNMSDLTTIPDKDDSLWTVVGGLTTLVAIIFTYNGSISGLLVGLWVGVLIAIVILYLFGKPKTMTI